MTNANGTFDGLGSFSNLVPINTNEPALFFDLRVQ